MLDELAESYQIAKLQVQSAKENEFVHNQSHNSLDGRGPSILRRGSPEIKYLHWSVKKLGMLAVVIPSSMNMVGVTLKTRILMGRSIL